MCWWYEVRTGGAVGLGLEIDLGFAGLPTDFAPLYRHATVMGMESQPNLDPTLPPSGLCNAIILAKPYSSFVGELLGSGPCFGSNATER